MFVIFRNNSEERLINIGLISAIMKDENNEQPCFRVEYPSGWFKFHSLEWNGFFRGTPTLADVWLALRYFEKLNILYDPKKELRGDNVAGR